MKKVLAVLLFSFLISIPVIMPFFHAGYFPTHDGEWAVVRLGDMFRTLRDFQIPPRYSGNLNFGYGYPLFNFAYPSPYYLGVFLHSFGIGLVDTIKFIFSAGVFLSAFFMFLASRILWKNTWAGIVSAVLYVYFPYRMVDLYVRGSIGESLSFALFPLLFYLAIKLISKPSSLLIGCIAISTAFLIMTHNIMTVLFLPAYSVLILAHAFLTNKKAIKPFLISIILGVGLAGFFWIPAVFEKNNILLSQIPIADRNLYFVNLSQFIFPRWGYGIPTDPNGFSYQLGLVHLAIFFAAILSLFLFLIKNRKYFNNFSVKIACILGIIIAFFVFMLFKPSKFLWENIPLLSEINYPWTALAILGFLISLMAGFFSKNVFGKYIVIFLGVIAMLLTMPYAKPEGYINNPDSYYLTNDATTTSSNELMPLWVKKMPMRRAEKKIEIISGSGKVEDVFSNSKKITFSVDVLSKSLIRINTIYYPGWKATVDSVDVPISYANEEGVMDIPVASGRHVISMDFGETQLRLIGDIISISSFLALLFLIARSTKYAFS